jgi:DNA-binding LacI/PurR family transcriptional regulator
VGCGVTAQDRAKVAAEAGVDPRTVARALGGSRRQSAAVRAAIVAALRSFAFRREAAALEKGGAS